MNRYTQYMIRQYFLNQAIPPLESHKILGSHFLYDLVNMHLFFKIKDYASNPNKTSNNQQEECIIEGPKYTGPSFDDIKQHWKNEYEEGVRINQEFTYNLMHSNNILCLPFQLFCKFILGFMIIMCRIFHLSLPIDTNKKQGD